MSLFEIFQLIFWMTEVTEFYKNLPKVDIHTHLHGTITPKHLNEILERCQRDRMELQNYDFSPLELENGRDLSKCFRYFTLIHLLVNNTKIVAEITEAAIQNYIKDNVKYVEFRTTPRACPETNMTKESYLETIISVFNEYNQKGEIFIRLILSLNRTSFVEDTNVLLKDIQVLEQLYLKHPEWIVGVDISGDPAKGNVTHAHMQLIKKHLLDKHNLPITIHTAEICGKDEEVDTILAFKPQRLGHCCCLNEAQQQKIVLEGLHVEICPTSNMFTLCIEDLAHHHFQHLHRFHSSLAPSLSSPTALTGNLTYSLNSDDFGLFHTTMTEEIEKFSTTFKLSREDVWDTQLEAIKHSFLRASDKEFVLKKFFSREAFLKLTK